MPDLGINAWNSRGATYQRKPPQRILLYFLLSGQAVTAAKLRQFTLKQ